jgi:DNA (cytosine-5)-methyltransferase 1
MYRKANDLKSNLILNALSWVDYLRADFCYFENVPGFLRFNLNAVQAGLYRVEGGIVMGGMKILLRSLQDMG